MKFRAFPLGISAAFSGRWTICLLIFLSLTLPPKAGHSQVRVDLVESGQTTQGKYFTYRIVGASYSATDQLKEIEELSKKHNTFSSFFYDEENHLCRVEVGEIGGDRSESLIRHYLLQVVGGSTQQVDAPREWADDDPRHGEVEHELPNAIPEPTDPSTMPDWGNMQPQKPIENETGTDQ